MPREATGLFSHAMVDSLRLAESMQAEAVLGIRDAYGTVPIHTVDLEGLTWEKFNEVLDRADRNGQREALEQELREMMADALMAVMTQGETGDGRAQP